MVLTEKPMVIKSIIKKNEYHDSVLLMRISEEIKKIEGVKQAAVLMATDNNKKVLEDIGLLTEEMKEASVNDLVIAINAINVNVAEGAVFRVDELLKERAFEVAEVTYKTLNLALDAMPDANLAVISVPGEFAAWEAKKAIERNLNVFLFSDNVPLEDEIELKNLARKRGLLMMGPECGTAIISSVALGFANVVNKGPIGVVGASGTGLQEVTSLISRDLGISQAIGTGGRDLDEEVGGIMTIEGIKALNKDEETKVIVVISKPPAPSVAKKVLDVIKESKKPVVVDFVGGDPKAIREAGAIPAFTLEDAAIKAIALVRDEKPRETTFTAPYNKIKTIANMETEKLRHEQRYVRGLFSGGTFCSEAVIIVTKLVGDVHSNMPLKPDLMLRNSNVSEGHTCVDMGAKEFTVGRPHPMIDLSLRQQRIVKEAKDPGTAVVLLDVVLGYGAHPDPAGALAPTIKEAKVIANKEGRYLPVVASICGTDRDPQNLGAQKRKLEEVGVILMPSNAQAARMAALITSRGKISKRLLG